MRISIPEDCGNSPRSKLVAELAVKILQNDYTAISVWLDDTFLWKTAGTENAEGIPGKRLEQYMRSSAASSKAIEELRIITAFSHGKYAAVSSEAHASNGVVYHSHDLYEFTGAGKSSKLRKITSYRISVNDCQ